MFTTINKFKKDTKGNVGMILAICLLPLMGFVGYAVDYNNASRQKAILQSASDMAALYIAKMKDPNKKEKAQQIAQDMVTQLAKEANIKNLTVKGSVANKTVSVTAEATSPNNFAQIFGFQDVKIGVLAQTLYAVPKIEVALVLDNTGSMCYNPVSDCAGFKAIVPATHSLINLFEDLKEDGENLAKISFLSYNSSVIQSEPLTYDWNKLHSMTNKMTASGSTNTGKAMLASHELLKKSDTKNRKFMIVVTDGDEFYDPALPDERHLWINHSCPKVKLDKSITIITIGLGVDLDAKTLIACSGEKNFYHVKDQSKLDETFKKIFAEISGLRLTN